MQLLDIIALFVYFYIAIYKILKLRMEVRSFMMGRSNRKESKVFRDQLSFLELRHEEEMMLYLCQ